ncbi:MAG: helix-turn-helix transcriptional regulator [Vicinamibacterales bacterium]
MTGDRLLTLDEVAARYGMATRTARYHVRRRTGRLPAPCQERPYKFRSSAVDAHLARLSVVDQRRRAAAAADEVGA